MTTVTAQAEVLKQAPVEPTPALEVKAPETDTLSPKFAALAKKEKWIRGMQEEINKQKKSLEERESDYKSNYVDKKRIKENFMDVISEAGLTPDQVANILLGQPQSAIDPSIREMRAEIKALKDELTSTKTGWSEKEKSQYDQAVLQVRSEAEELLTNDTGTFETLKTKANAVDIVTQFIEATYKDEGRVLKVDEAAEFIESELLEQAIAMAKLKKVQEKLGLTTAQVEPSKPQISPQQQLPKTLTNGMNPSSKPLSAKDRRERAIAAFQGKL